MKEYDKLIFEISRPGRKGYQLPADNYGRMPSPQFPLIFSAKTLRNSRRLRNLMWCAITLI